MFGTIPDTNYIRDYKDLLTTRIFFLFQDASLSVFNESTGNHVFKPYVPMRFGIAGFYKWFGLGLSAGIPATRNNYDKFVETDLLDFRVLAYSRIGTVELYYQQFEGFYLKEEESPGNYYDFPDMKSYSGGIIGNYVYNYARYSLRAAFLQNEQQLKSAGSILIRPSIQYYRIIADSTLFPEKTQGKQNYSQGRQMSVNNTWTIAVAPGYAYTLVFAKHFYLNASVFAGVNYQWGYYQTRNGSNYAVNDVIFNTLGRFSAGYNSDKWYIGASIILNFYEFTSATDRFQTFYNLNQLRIWVGTRFNAFWNKKWKK